MYLEVDEGFPGHKKTLRLCSLLKNPEAGWYMVRLWTWACRSCESGDLRGMSPLDIEMVVQYRKLDGACYRAMAESGYIDETEPGSGMPAEIHDWMDHTGGAIQKMAETAADKKEYRAHAKKQCGPSCKFCAREAGHSTPRPRTVHGRGTDESDQDKARQDQSSPGKTSIEDQDTGAEPAVAAPALVTFPCSGSPDSWGMTDIHQAEWTAAYPAVDVLGEALKALVWINANPTKRKTARGMARFLVSWMSRCQDKGGSSPMSPRPAYRDPSIGRGIPTTDEPTVTGRVEMP